MSWPNLPPAYATVVQSQDVFAAPGNLISAINGGGGPAPPGTTPPSAAPTAPLLYAATQDSITIRFDAAGITGTAPIAYNCLFGTAPSPNQVLLASLVSGTIYTATATGLTAGVTYYFASQAANSAGRKASVATPIRTDSLIPVFSPPGIPATNVVTSNLVSMSFYAPNDEVGSPPLVYDVLYGQTPTPGLSIPSFNTGNSTLYFAEATNLVPNTTYYFASRVTNPVNSRTSAVISTTTGSGVGTAPGAVPTPALTSASLSSINVFFDVSTVTGTAPITYSTLYGPTNPPTTPAIASLISGTLYSTIVNNLPSSSTVFFDVLAVNGAGQTRSPVAALSTLTPSGQPASAPGIPSPIVYNSTTNAVSLAFDTAGQTGSPPVSYTLGTARGSNVSSLSSFVYTDAAVSTGTIYSATGNNIQPGNYYSFLSRAINAFGSSISATSTFLAPTQNNAPGLVPPPTLVSATNSTLTVAIDSAGVTGTQPISYSVRYSDNPNFPPSNATGAGTAVLSTGTTQYILTVSTLATNTNFTLRSIATNSAGTYTEPAPFAAFSTLDGRPMNIPAPTLVKAGISSLTLALDTASITGPRGPYTMQPLLGTSPSTATTGYQLYTLSTGTIYTTTVSGIPGIPYLIPGTSYWAGTNVANGLGNNTGAIGGPFSTVTATPTGSIFIPPPLMLNSTNVNSVYVNTSQSGGTPPISSVAFLYNGTGAQGFVTATQNGSVYSAILPPNTSFPTSPVTVFAVGYQNISSALVSTTSSRFYTYFGAPAILPTGVPSTPVIATPADRGGIAELGNTFIGVANSGCVDGNGTGSYLTRWSVYPTPLTNSTFQNSIDTTNNKSYTVINGLLPSTNYTFQNIFTNGATTLVGPSTVIGTLGAPPPPPALAPNTPSTPTLFQQTTSSLVWSVDLAGQPAGTVATMNLQPGGYNVPCTPIAGTTSVAGTYSTPTQLAPYQLYTVTATAINGGTKTGAASATSQILSAPAGAPTPFNQITPYSPNSILGSFQSPVQAGGGPSTIGYPTQPGAFYGIAPSTTTFSTTNTSISPTNGQISLLIQNLQPSQIYLITPFLSNPISTTICSTVAFALTSAS